MLRLGTLCFAAALIVLVFGTVCAQTTEFTYQGSLRDGGSPANTIYDFEFALFDTLAGPNQIGPTLPRDGVLVTNGVFAVKLDFGSVFPGANRYLEVRVRLSGQPGITTLGPRQLINSVPYSVKSINADSAAIATTATNATNATNAVNATNLTGNLTGDVTGTQGATVVATVGGQSAANVANAAQSVSTATANNTANTLVKRDGSGNFIAGTITGTLTGNASTATNAANATQLNGQPASFYQNAANLSSGTLPVARLPVPLTLIGTSAAHIISGQNASTALDSSGVYGFASAATGRAFGVWGESASTSGYGVYGQATAATGSTYGLYGASNSVNGTGVFGYAINSTGVNYGGEFQSNSTNGRGVYGGALAATGTTYGMFGESNSTSGTGVFGQATNPNGTNYGVYGRSYSPSGYGVYGLSSAAGGQTYGVYGESNSTTGYSAGVYGKANAASGLTLGVSGQSFSPIGIGVYGYASDLNGTNYGGYFESSSTSGTGVFGSGFYGGHFQSNSMSGIGVDIAATGDGATLLRFSTERPWVFRQVRTGSTTGLQLLSTIGGKNFEITAAGNTNVATFVGDDANPRVGIGTTAPDQTLSVNGNASKVGGGSWLVFSDERLKNIKGRYTPGLAAVMRLQPLRYQYKPDNAMSLRAEGEYVGFSAQAVEQIILEAVTKNDQGYRLVNNDPIMWAMLNAVKEQQQIILNQQRQIGQLKKIVCLRNKKAGICKERTK